MSCDCQKDAPKVTPHPFSPQPIYVRAKTERGRQEWLIALGSAKAAGGSGGGCAAAAANAAVNSPKIASPPLDPIAEGNGHLPGSSAAAAKLKTRRSELRLYHDMLVQQVANIRDGANGQDLEVQGYSNICQK